MNKRPIVVAISGSSGVSYGRRLVEVLAASEQSIYLTISPAANQVIGHELKLNLDLDDFDPAQLLPNDAAELGRVDYLHYLDFLAPIASGSFLTKAMVICPCSGATLSGVAHGSSRNLIERAAEVHLKERRRLILVPRETPLSLAAIENMRAVTLAGATVLPAMPAWYHGVTSLDHLVDFVVARILDQLGVEHSLISRWGEQP